MKEKLCKLIDVKSIVTFAVIGTLCGLAIRQNVTIPTEVFAAVVSSVITYFFTKKSSSRSDE